VVISRSGFTNELGWEIYMPPEIDFQALGDHLMQVGEPFGMRLTGTPVFRARRIEAGLLNAGSDFDETTTPFDAGLGGFVDLDKTDFVGRDALLVAPKECRTWGMRVEDGIALLGRQIKVDGQVIGRVCSSTWSPFLKCGVAIVRMDDPTYKPGMQVTVNIIDGHEHGATICTLPMYDEKREIPRGKSVDIPEIPAS
jgi:aminomethyltransferase